MLRPVLQILAIYLSLYTGFSRISDYKHHWSDVLIGLIQGATVAILTHVVVRELVHKQTSSQVDSPTTAETHVTGAQQGKDYRSCSIELRDE